jgi:hypothetical protein
MKHPIVIFYHIYCHGKWEELVEGQLRKLRDSGVYDECLSMFVRVIGTPDDIDRYYSLIKGMKKIHTIQADNKNDHEVSILKAIRMLATETFPYREAANLEASVLYLHTKGVYSSRESEEIASRMTDWREYMEHFVVENWKECISSLDEGFDVCGVDWREQSLFGPIVGHFSGNFWWAKLSYIYTLPEIKDDWDRAYYEFWIGQRTPKAKCLYESGVDHYHENYAKDRYSK